MELPTQTEAIKALRVNIDAVIQTAKALKETPHGVNCQREISLVITKLEEGKMWGGKCLEAIGNTLPPEFADKAV